jgi:hypothetical protein
MKPGTRRAVAELHLCRQAVEVQLIVLREGGLSDGKETAKWLGPGLAHSAREAARDKATPAATEPTAFKTARRFTSLGHKFLTWLSFAIDIQIASGSVKIFIFRELTALFAVPGIRRQGGYRSCSSSEVELHRNSFATWPPGSTRVTRRLLGREQGSSERTP